jgi:hypothetical protein
MKMFEWLDEPTTTLLLGLAVGLGIAVHPVFFLVALVIAIVAVGRHVFHMMAESAHHLKMTHRHA